MIFNFRIVSDEVDNFKREIQIDSTATFLDLKKAICKSVGYDTTQMSSFFLCDRNWEKEKEIKINHGEPIVNELKRGSIEIIKTTKDKVYYSADEKKYLEEIEEKMNKDETFSFN